VLCIGNVTVGAYTAEERARRIEKFLQKRSRRVWTKKVKYSVRKVLPRIERFRLPVRIFYCRQFACRTSLTAELELRVDLFERKTKSS
jgi:hypothetical protein